MNPALKEYRNIVSRRVAKYEASVEVRRNTKRRLKKAKAALSDALKAQEIAQSIAATVQQRAHDRIAKVVSHCLESVFDEPYEFRIVFEKKRGRTQASLVFTRNGRDVDPMTACGGGVVDVAAFALRLSCLMLSKESRRVMVLDEPFRFVSEEYIPKVRDMILRLSEEFKMQFILVTHIRGLEMGHVVRL